MPTENKKKENLTPSQARLKAANFCAYQERTQKEVRDKLYELGQSTDDVEEIISWLITENYLNEERFAKAFVGGKFRIKKWGRNKILQELKARNISPYCIKKGMLEIDEEGYHQNLLSLLEKKSAELKEKNPLVRNHKLSQYLLSKGYESELIWEVLKSKN